MALRAVTLPLAVVGARGGVKRSRQGRVSVVMPQLMGALEAAEELGTTAGNLGKWTTLPEPVADLACGRIWLADDIRALARERKA